MKKINFKLLQLYKNAKVNHLFLTYL